MRVGWLCVCVCVCVCETVRSQNVFSFHTFLLPYNRLTRLIRASPDLERCGGRSRPGGDPGLSLAHREPAGGKSGVMDE